MKANDITAYFSASFVLIAFSWFSIWIYSKGLKALQRKRLIENTPASKIRSMAMGLVEINGKAKPFTGLLKGPLTGKECVFYDYIIEGSYGGGRWNTLAKDISDHYLFYIDDGTGKVLVNPAQAEINLFRLEKPTYEVKLEHNGLKNLGDHIPANLINLMSQKNIECKSRLVNISLRFREWDIYPDNEVYILGTVHKNDNYFSGFKDSLNERFRKLKTNQEEMKKFDADGDGTINIVEWEQAVNLIKQQMLEEQLQQPEKQQDTAFVIEKGKEEEIFIISKESEKAFCQTLSSGARIVMFIGAFMMIFVAFFIFIYIYSFTAVR